eukprot:scaffold14056_cov119-Isochrysis_galbana.AAC.3
MVVMVGRGPSPPTIAFPANPLGPRAVPLRPRPPPSRSSRNQLPVPGGGDTALSTGDWPANCTAARVQLALPGAASSAPTVWSSPCSSAHWTRSRALPSHGKEYTSRLRMATNCHTHAQVSGPSDSDPLSRDSQFEVSRVGASGAPSIAQAGRARARQSGPTRVTGHWHTPRSGSHVPNSPQPGGHGRPRAAILEGAGSFFLS